MPDNHKGVSQSIPSGENRQGCFTIARFTLQFDFVEDRLRLDAINTAGAVQSIWLTQRLANKLIGALAKDLDRELSRRLDENATGQQQDMAKAPRAPSPQLSALAHGIAQQEQRLRNARRACGQTPQAPQPRNASVEQVHVPAHAPDWLCKTIQLAPRPGGRVVSFTDDASVTARFFMSHRNARAVLDGLAGQYRKANWPLMAFPDWVRDVEFVGAGAAQRRVLN